MSEERSRSLGKPAVEAPVVGDDDVGAGDYGRGKRIAFTNGNGPRRCHGEISPFLARAGPAAALDEWGTKLTLQSWLRMSAWWRSRRLAVWASR